MPHLGSIGFGMFAALAFAAAAVDSPARGDDPPKPAAAPADTHPFRSEKYGLEIDLPDSWTLAESERDDRVFVALVPNGDADRPGVAACELGLAPESLDEFRTRIDGNARRAGPRGGTLVSNRVVDDPKRPRLETLREFRPSGGGLWRELTIRVIANRQLYAFILNAEAESFDAARPLFEKLAASARLTPPNTGADRLVGNRWIQREFKFTLDLPDGWSPVLAPSEVALLYANTLAKGIWADNVLVVAKEHRPRDLERLARDFPDQLRAAEPNCEVIACEVVPQGNGKALETIVRTRRGPFSMTVLERRFRGERFDYEIKYTIESDRFDPLLPKIRSSVESFKELPGNVPRPGTGKAA
ncbi:MAG: hypothetical protein SFX72_15480 [Isosphaeraceae bacterium]|nr:hypothetical protein [Isosphaeraceae bacterium]